MRVSIKGVVHYSYSDDIQYFKANVNYYDINSDQSTDALSTIFLI